MSHFARSGRKRCCDANVYPGGLALLQYAAKQLRLRKGEKKQRLAEEEPETVMRLCLPFKSVERILEHVF